MPLTNLRCQNAKPKDKPYKLGDSGGMYLEVMPNGSKYWRLKYRWLTKETRLALGVFPLVSLAEAREKRDAARKLIASGINPAVARNQARRKAILNAENSFEKIAREWHAKQQARWKSRTASKVLHYLENDLFPYIGSRPISDIDPPELLAVLRKIEDKGNYHTAGKVRQYSGHIFRYAIATGRAQRDPSADLKGALATGTTVHFASLEIKEMPQFLNALERNDARLYSTTRRAIRLLMLTFTRTNELIMATWDEIDFEKAQWNISGERMKMGKPHLVPLSRQAKELFLEQKKETEHLNTAWVFPNQVRPKKPMSNNTILFGIGRLGYKGRMTGHGFRSLAMTTLMEELGYPFDIPDTQLAHAKGDSVRRAYDRTKYLPQRRIMMQEWSDYLDTIAANGKVIAWHPQKASDVSA